MMNDEKSKDSRESIQKRPHWTDFGANEWLMMVFGSALSTVHSTDDVINLKQKGVGQKMIMG